MNEFVERSPGGKLFHSCEHPPLSILRCITTLRLLAGVRDGEHIDLSGREGVYQSNATMLQCYKFLICITSLFI